MITTTEHPTDPNPRRRWTATAPALDWTEHGPTEQVAVFRLRERAALKLLTVRSQLRALAEAVEDDAREDRLLVRIIGTTVRVMMRQAGGETFGEWGEGRSLYHAINDLFTRLDSQLPALLCVVGNVVPAPTTEPAP
jgi:hypothetical protein